MDKIVRSESPDQSREPWNKGKVIGARPPLPSKACLGGENTSSVSHRARDVALFNLAIDSKLRGCDVVSLKVADVARQTFALDRASVGQRKRVIPFASKSRSKHVRPLTTISPNEVGSQAHISSLDVDKRRVT